MAGKKRLKKKNKKKRAESRSVETVQSPVVEVSSDKSSASSAPSADRSSYNPDVLTCIANLSSDEVFTPPQLVNRMLDLLPPELWSDPDATFLDPGCKSGVFLREIA